MLPQIDTLDAYRPIFRDVNTWLPALQAICRRHGFDPASLRQAPPGSHIVFWVGSDCLIKLFAPLWAADAAREVRALRAMAGVSQVCVPQMIAEGQLEGWPYMIITRLPGQPLDELWPGLSFGEQMNLAGDLGRLMASMHAIPTAGLDPLQENWPAFIHSQPAVCLERQRALGVPAHWLDELAAFLADLPALVEPGFQPVLLHADLNPEHLFCERGPAGWQITGVIDFGDAILGHPYYEFVAPGFLLGTAPELRRAMLLAYGLRPDELTAELSHRLMAYTLLHRFAHLPEMLGRFGTHPPVGMAELQAALWGFA